MQYKVGDRVKCLQEVNDDIKKGKIYTVVGLCQCGCDDGIKLNSRDKDWVYDSHIFGAVKPTNAERMKQRRKQLCNSK